MVSEPAIRRAGSGSSGSGLWIQRGGPTRMRKCFCHHERPSGGPQSSSLAAPYRSGEPDPWPALQRPLRQPGFACR